MSKIETVLWFIKRPSFYPHLVQLIRRRLFYEDEKGKEEAIEWCRNQVGDKSAMLDSIHMNEIPEDSFFDRHENLMERGRDISSRIPVKMGGPGDLDLLYQIVKRMKPDICLETGVAYGWSSLAILMGLRENGSGSLVSIDMPYPKMNNESFVGCAVPSELKTRWRLIRKPDRIALPDALKSLGSIDFCHYDSDKSYLGRKWAYPLLWKYLKMGGAFISDDIQDNIAFKEFCDSVDRIPFISEFDNKYVGVLIK